MLLLAYRLDDMHLVSIIFYQGIYNDTDGFMLTDPVRTLKPFTPPGR